MPQVNDVKRYYYVILHIVEEHLSLSSPVHCMFPDAAFCSHGAQTPLSPAALLNKKQQLC